MACPCHFRCVPPRFGSCPCVRPHRLASGPLSCVLQSVHGPAQTRALAPHRLGERRGWPAIAEIFHINVWFFYGLTPQYITAAAQFEWDDNKDAEYQAKHHVSFRDAQAAFADPHRVIAKDLAHSEAEERFYCIGKAGGGILTVRFTYRRKVIRIIGAGYWRKGKAMYEKEDRLHG